MSDEQTPLFGGIDVDLQAAGILAHHEQFIAYGRQVLPTLTFYRNGAPIISVNSRSFDDINDRDRAIRELLQLLPFLNSDVSILSFVDPVHLISGQQDAVVIIAVTTNAALTKVYPWVINEDKTVSFDHDAQLNPDAHDVYSPKVQHMLQVFVRVHRPTGSAKDMVNILMSLGHDFTFMDDYTPQNLDARCFL